MIKNYFKIAWRNVLKNKSLFFINIIGLAIGIATCLIITLFVVDELSYDKYNEKVNDIVRVVLRAKMGDELINEASVMAPVAHALVNELPEVLDATRILKSSYDTKVTYKENTLRTGKLAFADANFFDVFTLPLLKGDPNTVLDKPNSIVLTKVQAETYFGNENPMLKTLEIHGVGVHTSEGYVDNSGLYTVTGIIDKIPDNSHFHFDLIASMKSNKGADNQSWMSGSYHTYLLLNDGVNLKDIEVKLQAITKKYMGSQLEADMGQTFEEFLGNGNEVGFFLQPLEDIHLQSDLTGEFEPNGDINSVYIFGVIALFMLLIACINFMNLSTAGASKRVKEIGMRKVLGSQKPQLIFQFLTESFISTLFAMVAGIVLFLLALPYFNQLSGKSLEFEQILNPQFLIAIACLTVLISFLAGGYPAFFMSSFKPIQALKNKFSTGSSKGIRSGLVIFQFSVSVCLIVATLVVSQQMNYIQNKDVGYDREELLVIRDAGRLGNNLNAYKEELSKDPRIVSITNSAFVPSGPTDNNATTIISHKDPSLNLRSKVYNIDEAYIPTLGMKVLAGRNFSKDFGSEEGNIIINETARKAFGLDTNPIGQTIAAATNLQGGRQTLTVVGMIKNFHSRSLREPIEPLIMKYNPYYGLIMKIKTSDMAGLLSSMEEKWKSFGSGETFGYAFLDELYNETYTRETNMNTILLIFALLTIFVACLGLFGLVTFTAEQRFKEIGIRKVLGSSVSQIVSMLAKDFLKLVVVSMGIAFPLGYYFMNKWLEDFTYRIDIEWWVYAVAGIATVLIAFMTISYRSIQAALMNPVKSLQVE